MEKCRRCGRKLEMGEWVEIGGLVKFECKCGLVYCKKWWYVWFDEVEWSRRRFGKEMNIEEVIEKFYGEEVIEGELRKEKGEELSDEMIEYEMIVVNEMMGWEMNSWVGCSLEEIIDGMVKYSLEEYDGWMKYKGKLKRLYMGLVKEGLVKKKYGW